MKRSLLVAVITGGVAAVPALSLAARPAAPAPAALHCQIPCGIYGDKMRIDMMMEDASTIEKGMKMLAELEGGDALNYNQIVRWVANKDAHAKAIQEQCLDYWLAQRIKAPQDQAGRARYLSQLEAVHGIIVAAMKCKQTTDLAHVAKLRSLALKFSESYFSPEDWKHIKEHHSGGE